MDHIVVFRVLSMSTPRQSVCVGTGRGETDENPRKRFYSSGYPAHCLILLSGNVRACWEVSSSWPSREGETFPWLEEAR